MASESPDPAPAPPRPNELAPVSGWATPTQSGTSGGSGRGCLIAALVAGIVLLAVLVLGVVGLIFLGGQVQEILAGTVEVGTGGEGCAVTGSASSFPSSSGPLHVVAWFERDVEAGEVVTMRLRYSQAGTPVRTESEDWTAPATTRCLAADPYLGEDWPIGHYEVDTAVEGEQLAAGEFEIVP